MLSLAKIALSMVTPAVAVAREVRLAVVVLIKPVVGVHAGVEAVHPYVLSSRIYPGKAIVLVPIAPGSIAEPAVLMM